MLAKNTDWYPCEIDADFDIPFFMAECPQCSCTMLFDLDEGVCMKCNCDPSDGIVDDMSESDLEALLHNNRYLLKLPEVIRQPFETLPQMLARQVEYRCNEAIKKFETLNKEQ